MGHRVKKICICLALLGGGFFAGDLLAAQGEHLLPEAEMVAEMSDFGEPVSSDVLLSNCGGQNMEVDNIDILLNNMKLNAQMDKNVLYSTSTGVNIISDEAFSNASGISTVIQNSGNQVIINNALILNLMMK